MHSQHINYTMFWHVTTFSVLIIETYALYNKSFSGLITFPHDIPLDETKLYLNGNAIEDIDYVDSFTYLKRLNLPHTLLTAFPNLANVSSSLLILILSENKLLHIKPSYLNDLVALEALYLSDNKLTTFPDVPGPLHLETLGLNKNDFNHFPKY